MTEVSDVLSKEQIDRVKDELNQDIVSLRCDRIFEDDPTVEFVGAGRGRCGFITNQDAFLKVARSKQGVIDNRRASNIFLVDDDLAEETFARPIDVDSSGVAMLQEEIDLIDDLRFEEVKRRIDKPESLQTDFFSESQVEGAARSNMQDKLDKVAEEENIVCDDIVNDNLGVKEDEGVVLADLGECRIENQEGEQNKGVREDRAEFI